MKKKILGIVCLLICVVTLLSSCSGGSSNKGTDTLNRLEKIIKEGKLVISTSPDYAPYEFIDPSKKGQESIVGADIIFAQYIADKLGVELVIETMNFDAALTAVQEGKVDLCISGLAYKEDRAKAMILSDGYNITGGTQGILVLKEKAGEYIKAEDFSDKLIGAQNASLQYENVVNQLPNAKVEPITNIADGIMMLRTGKIDALASSTNSGEQYAKNYDDLAMSDFLFEYDTYSGNRIGIKNGETELEGKINEIIATINADGSYEKWTAEATALSEEIAKGE